MRFDYFYGSEAEQFSFFRIPKLLMTDPVFAGLSIEAKFLYGLLLDRMGMSRKNKWLDENDRVYIIYAISEIAEDMNVSEKLAMQYLKELEKTQLLEKKKRGFGFPSLLFVRNFLDKPERSAQDFDGASDTVTDEDGVIGSDDGTIYDNTSENGQEEAFSVSSGTSFRGSSVKSFTRQNRPGIIPKSDRKQEENHECEEKKCVETCFEPAEIQESSQTVSTELPNQPLQELTVREPQELTKRAVQELTVREPLELTKSAPQSNTDSNNININNTYKSNTDSILSNPIFTKADRAFDGMGSDMDESRELNIAVRKSKDPVNSYMQTRYAYKRLIKKNIDFDALVIDRPHRKEFYETIVELILEVVMSSRETITVAGNDFPTEVVKSRLLKIDMFHVQYVEECMEKTTTDIKNIKKYLLAALYNAPVTIGSYYGAMVNHDFAEGRL